MRPDIALGDAERRGENIARQACARCFKAVTRRRYLLYQVSLTEMFIHSYRQMTSMARVTRCRRVPRASRCDSDRKEGRMFGWDVLDALLPHHGNAIEVPARLMTMAALVRLKRGSVQLRHAALEVKGTCTLSIRRSLGQQQRFDFQGSDRRFRRRRRVAYRSFMPCHRVPLPSRIRFFLRSRSPRRGYVEAGLLPAENCKLDGLAYRRVNLSLGVSTHVHL